jgi:hypothetical protein
MKTRLIQFIEALTDEQLHKIERAILEIANHGQTQVTFDVKTNDVADQLLNY